MIWVFRNIHKGFEDLSEAEMISLGLTKVTNRLFTGESFDLSSSSYTSFMVREVSRGESPEEAIQNFNEEIPSPFRMEKIKGKRRDGSLTYAALAAKHLKGEISGTDPASIILIFTADNKTWIAGFVTEKKDSLIDKMEDITMRTCVSLTSRAALALVNIAGEGPIVDPCCGTGLIPLASVLRQKEAYGGDNNHKMIRMARANRESLGVELEIKPRDALVPWMEGVTLITDFPADRSWTSVTENLSLHIFEAWLPHIKNFCVIFPNRIVEKLPSSIEITKKISFTADRTIILGKGKWKG